MCIVLHAALFSRFSVIPYFIEYFALVCSEISVYYRPHTKFAKVVVLHLFISHSVHSGGGGLHQGGLHLGGLHPGGLHPGVCIWGVCIKRGESASKGVCIQGGLHPGGLHPGGLHQGGSASGGSASRRGSLHPKGVCFLMGLHPGGPAFREVCLRGVPPIGYERAVLLECILVAQSILCWWIDECFHWQLGNFGSIFWVSFNNWRMDMDYQTFHKAQCKMLVINLLNTSTCDITGWACHVNYYKWFRFWTDNICLKVRATPDFPNGQTSGPYVVINVTHYPITCKIGPTSQELFSTTMYHHWQCRSVTMW